MSCVLQSRLSRNHIGISSRERRRCQLCDMTANGLGSGSPLAAHLTQPSRAALSLSRIALTVAGYQRVLPRAVGTPSRIRPSAIAWYVRPLRLSLIIRRVNSIGSAGEAPRRSPRARLAANASRVRWLINRRSYCEPEMMMFAAISPAGELVSISRSAKCNAQPSRRAASMRPAPSTTDLLSRSIFATSSPAAFRPRTADSAVSAPGRPFNDLALIP